MNRQRFLGTLLAAPFAVAGAVASSPHRVVVYKDPTCGCCGKWAEHLHANDFVVEVQEVNDTADYSPRLGVPSKLRGCHTAVVEGYSIEGHVPAVDMHRLLRERPEAKGLSVPGMPVGSPGMEGGQRQAYSVLLFGTDGKTSVFQHHPAKRK